MVWKNIFPGREDFVSHLRINSFPRIFLGIIDLLQRKLFLIFVKLGLNGKEVLCLPGAASRTRTYARRSYPSCFGALVAIIIAKGKLQPNVPSDTPISIISKKKPIIYRIESISFPSFNAEGVAISDLLSFLRIHGYCAFQVDPVPASVSFSGEGFVLQLRQAGPFTIFISLGGCPHVNWNILSLYSRFWYFSDKHKVRSVKIRLRISSR